MQRVIERTWGDTGEEWVLLDEKTTIYDDTPPITPIGIILGIIFGGIAGGLIGAFLSRRGN
jgi:hypothetical protein